MRIARVSCSVLAMALALVAAPAWAQDASTGQAEQPAQEDGLQEIVVTAQRRAESLQDVPIAISVFSADAITEQGVGNLAALSRLAPNVNLDAGTPFSGSTAVISATIRGIGSDDFAFNIDPGVGIYLDGIYLARTVGANLDLPDVARVEVLKGPQGTLFGRNTIGGAISIVTREPGRDFGITGDVTTGRFNYLRFRGTVDLPLADNFRTSLTVSSSNRDGFLRRVPFTGAGARFASNSDSFLNFNHSSYRSAEREGGEGSFSMRGRAIWEPSDRFRVSFSGDYSHSDNSGQASKLLGTFENLPGPFAGTANLPGTAFSPTNTGFLFGGLYNFCINSTPAQIAARNAQALCGARGTQFLPNRRLTSFASVNVDADPTNDRIPWDSRFLNPNIDESYSTGPSFSKLTAWGVAGTLEYDLTPDIQIKSITGYRKTNWKAGGDYDGSPLSIVEITFEQNQWQFSEELQLLGSALDDKLTFVGGAYYFEEKGNLHDFVTFNEGLVQVDGPNRFDTSNYAFFGQVDYRPINLISFTIGGRYTNETKRFEGSQQELNGFNYRLFGCSAPDGTIAPLGQFPLAPPGVPCFAGLSFPSAAEPTRVYVPGVNRAKFNNFSPRVGVQLHPSEDLLIFGSWSRGYKTGGWTTRLTNPQGNVAPDFGPEKAETFEAGVKATLLDRRLQVNASVFTTEYTGVQLNIQIGTSPTIDNAGDARIKGAELEIVAQPLRGFTITGALGYLDTAYTAIAASALVNSSAIPGIQRGIAIGAPLPKSAEWKFNLSPRYEHRLPDGSGIIALADWSHASSFRNDIAGTELLFRPATDMFNASIQYVTADDSWSLTLGGTNLSNERFVTTGGLNLSAGTAFGSYNRPREWFARLGFKF